LLQTKSRKKKRSDFDMPLLSDIQMGCGESIFIIKERYFVLKSRFATTLGKNDKL